MSSESALTDDLAQRRSGKHAAFLAFAEALLRASRGEQDPAAADQRQFVTFVVRDLELGIPVMQCREVIRVSALTRIPEAPAHVRGVVNLRGRILPVVDMRRCLGFEALQPTSRTRLVVVEAAGRFFALLVDRVLHILKLGSADIAPAAPDGLSPLAGSACTGRAAAGDATVHLIDVERVLATVARGKKPLESEKA